MPLQKSDLQNSKIWKDALKEGELVFAMDQSKTPAHETQGPWGWAAGGYDGYCMGIVMQWLATRKDGKDFEYDKTTKLFNNPHWHSTKYHNIYMNLPTHMVTATSGDTVKVDIRDTIRSAGMLVKSAGVKVDMTARNWRTQLTAMSGNARCYVTLFGHAVAAEKVGNSARFFDPNFGHFRFTNFARFETWMASFLKESGYDRHFSKMQFFFVA